jgi:hypothetical protein
MDFLWLRIGTPDEIRFIHPAGNFTDGSQSKTGRNTSISVTVRRGTVTKTPPV